MLFTGESELSIDAKHRLAIPAKIRAGMDPEMQGVAFYVTKGDDGSLWLWPERTFERVAGELEPSLTPDPELMDFDAITFPKARRLDVDTAGRIRLPEEMIVAAELGSKVVLAGMRHHLEIWDPPRWAERCREMEARRADILLQARNALRKRGSGG